jgi:hypothetical protein
MGGARDPQTERILLKRHPKRDINKGPIGLQLMSTCKGTFFPFIAVLVEKYHLNSKQLEAVLRCNS